jgi:hypothetical protein
MGRILYEKTKLKKFKIETIKEKVSVWIKYLMLRKYYKLVKRMWFTFYLKFKNSYIEVLKALF